MTFIDFRCSKHPGTRIHVSTDTSNRLSVQPCEMCILEATQAMYLQTMEKTFDDVEKIRREVNATHEALKNQH